MDRETTCCFTGHRPNKLPWGTDESDPGCIALKDAIRREIETAYDRGYRHFICGMARGCDLYFCEEVQALRDRREGVTLEAAIPCETQADKWPQADRERYKRLVGLCDFETMIQREYDRNCMLRRNRYMVDHSSRLIAALDGSRGGTLYTAAYAMKQGLELVIIDF